LPGLNGSGAAAAVPKQTDRQIYWLLYFMSA